jgi:hypothetical protein
MPMKITKANEDGKMPWSTTVVNVERRKTKKRRMGLTIGVLAAVFIVSGSCLACGALGLIKPAPARAATTIQTPAPTATRGVGVLLTPVPTARPGWTQQGLVQYKVVPLTK